MSGGGNWFKAFPNWAARQIQSAGVTYTAKSYGYVLFRNVNYTDTCSGYINGAKVFLNTGPMVTLKIGIVACFQLTLGLLTV